MVPELRGLSYGKRCSRLGLFTMKQRRDRIDLLLIFRTVVLGDYPDLTHMFQRSECSQTRGHQFELSIQRTDHLPHIYRLSRRSVSTWNNLPTTVVLSTTVAEFKRKLDEVLWSHDNYLT